MNRLDKGELFELYKLSLSEVRYNVQLGWERTKYLLSLTTTLTVAALR